MTTAQKQAQANFKKAIAYRKKTGCSLKEAFAHVKGHKVTGLDKVIKKGNKTSVLYTKTAKKKAATKKKVNQGVLFGVKKKAAKKSAVKSTHKDTKSHNVNIRVVSGIKKSKDKILKRISVTNEEYIDTLIDIENFKKELKDAIKLKKDASTIKYYKDGIKMSLDHKKELKEHIKQMKKHL